MLGQTAFQMEQLRQMGVEVPRGLAENFNKMLYALNPGRPKADYLELPAENPEPEAQKLLPEKPWDKDWI